MFEHTISWMCCSRVRSQIPTQTVAGCRVECQLWDYLMTWLSNWNTVTSQRSTTLKDLESLHMSTWLQTASAILVLTSILDSNWMDIQSTGTSAPSIPTSRCSLLFNLLCYASLTCPLLHQTIALLSLYRYLFYQHCGGLNSYSRRSKQPLGIFKIALVTFPEYVLAARGVRFCSASGSKIQHGGRKTGSCVGWMVLCCVWRFLRLLRVSFSWYFDSILLLLLLVCVSFTIIGQPRNSVLIRRV